MPRHSPTAETVERSPLLIVSQVMLMTGIMDRNYILRAIRARQLPAQVLADGTLVLEAQAVEDWIARGTPTAERE